ncbi:uncharacterized protein LOC115224351 isoform X1 [Argonauta hians]
MASAYKFSKLFGFVSRKCFPLIRSQSVRLVVATTTVARLRSTLHVNIDNDYNPPTLTKIPEFDAELLKTKDATTSLLEVTIDSLVKAENECAQLIYRLVDYYSEYIKHVGRFDEEGERLWTLVVETRTQIDDCKETIQRLNLILNSLTKLMKQLAEVAFMAGDEEESSTIYSMTHPMWQLAEEAKSRRMYASELMGECLAKDILATSDAEPRYTGVPATRSTHKEVNNNNSSSSGNSSSSDTTHNHQSAPSPPLDSVTTDPKPPV